MMTRQDYQLIADHIKHYLAGMQTSDEKREFVEDFISPLCARLKTNPAFNTQRFLSACGVAPEVVP